MASRDTNGTNDAFLLTNGRLSVTVCKQVNDEVQTTYNIDAQDQTGDSANAESAVDVIEVLEEDDDDDDDIPPEAKLRQVVSEAPLNEATAKSETTAAKGDANHTALRPPAVIVEDCAEESLHSGTGPQDGDTGLRHDSVALTLSPGSSRSRSFVSSDSTNSGFDESSFPKSSFSTPPDILLPAPATVLGSMFRFDFALRNTSSSNSVADVKQPSLKATLSDESIAPNGSVETQSINNIQDAALVS